MSTRTRSILLSLLILFADSARSQSFPRFNRILLCGAEVNVIEDGRPPVEFDFCPLLIGGAAILALPALASLVSVGAGSWSSWTNVGSCSSQCGTGLQTRTRTCSGYGCLGNSVDTTNCTNLVPCPDSDFCYSGTSLCSYYDDTDRLIGYTYDYLSYSNYNLCLTECNAREGCNYFTAFYYGSGTECYFYSTCKRVPNTVDECGEGNTCFSGQKYCNKI